jgi:hypothetical protein
MNNSDRRVALLITIVLALAVAAIALGVLRLLGMW